MPCQLYLRGDSDPLWLAAPADQVLAIVEDPPSKFVRLDMVPALVGEPPRAAYFDPAAVVAILPLDPRELADAYEHPPGWLS